MMACLFPPQIIETRRKRWSQQELGRPCKDVCVPIKQLRRTAMVPISGRGQQLSIIILKPTSRLVQRAANAKPFFFTLGTTKYFSRGCSNESLTCWPLFQPERVGSSHHRFLAGKRTIGQALFQSACGGGQVGGHGACTTRTEIVVVREAKHPQ
jgi:hypothetical protein